MEGLCPNAWASGQASTDRTLPRATYPAETGGLRGRVRLGFTTRRQRAEPPNIEWRAAGRPRGHSCRNRGSPAEMKEAACASFSPTEYGYVLSPVPSSLLKSALVYAYTDCVTMSTSLYA